MSTMSPTVFIDPGASGGLAVLTSDGHSFAAAMPEGMTAQADYLRSLCAANCGLRAVMEKTGTYMPGNSGPASVKFARHCGHLEAILYTLGVPTEQVAPGVWQKALGALPKDKQERKRAIRDEMARRFPHLEVTLKTADALGILNWWVQK